MALPKFENFLYPFLLKLKNGDEVSKHDVKKHIVSYFKLTKEDCELKTKSGLANQVDDRIGWTRQWLRRALFITIPKRGFYKITERGKKYLESHTSLKQDDLMAYSEFASYANSSSKKDKLSQIEDNSISSEQTPTEQLDHAYQIIVKDLAADLLQKVLEQTPQRFERIVVDLLLAMGYGGSLDGAGMVTKSSHDDGIDGIIKEDKLGLDNIYIQAKRYAIGSTIGKPVLHAFAGALDEQKASKGVFITTSKFSSEARKYAEKKASKKIALIDGEELARYMIEYNIGVSTKRTFVVKRIDMDYFDGDESDV